MTTTAVKNAIDYSAYPMKEAIALRNASNDELTGTWGQALGSRALFLAQLIISIVVLPLILLAMIFVPTLALCLEDEMAAWKNLKEIGLGGLFHLSAIPSSLVATFAPHSWEWISPTKEVLNCFE